MRFSPLFAALALALPLAAHADTMDAFTLTGVGVTATWSAPSTVTLMDYSLYDSISQGVTATINGTPGYSVGTTYYTFIYPFLSAALYFPPGSPDGLGILPLSGMDVYSWTTIPATNPPNYLAFDVVATFDPGLYTLNTVTGATYTLDIEPEVTTPTPEPASIVLLATGVLAALGAGKLSLLARP